MRRFTILVNKVHQSTVDNFEDLKLYHEECAGYSITIKLLNAQAFSLKCKRCKREIIVKDNANGNIPIMQTAVDGEPRQFNHELAKETVKVKE